MSKPSPRHSRPKTQPEKEDTLALVRRESSIQVTETERQFKDRTIVEAYERLHQLKEPTDEQKKEFEDLADHYVAIQIATGGYLAALCADKHMRITVHQLYENIANDLGQMTAIKKLLLERFLSAVSDGYSYDLMFMNQRYRLEEGQNMIFNQSPDRIKSLAEIRKGKASADERILRLAQALGPSQLMVKVKNAVFAQNMQINQGVVAKDLEKNSEPNNNEKTAT